jgi:putative effector of murein hydrolase
VSTVICLGAVLVLTGTPYRSYFADAQFVDELLGPAVVALGLALWQRRQEVRRCSVVF